MKTSINLLPGSKLRQTVFTLICALLVTAGWAGKPTVDRIGEIQDELAKDMEYPTADDLLLIQKRVNAHIKNAIRPERVIGKT